MRHDLFQTHRFSHLRTLCGAARRLTRTTTYSIHGVRCGSWWYKIQSVGLWMACSRHWQHVDSISERHRLVNWDGWNKEYGAKSIAREFADGFIATASRVLRPLLAGMRVRDSAVSPRDISHMQVCHRNPVAGFGVREGQFSAPGVDCKSHQPFCSRKQLGKGSPPYAVVQNAADSGALLSRMVVNRARRWPNFHDC